MMGRRRLWVCGLVSLYLIVMAAVLFSVKGVVSAADDSRTQNITQENADSQTDGNESQQDETTQEQEDTDAEEYLDLIFKELNLQEVDDFSEDVLPERMTLSGVTKTLLGSGISGIDASSLMEWVADVFFYELSEAKPFFIQMLLCALLFSVCNRFFIDGKRYINHLSFLFIYGAMMILLLRSFLLVGDVVEEGIDMICDFMKTLIPAYATTLLLSGNAASAGAFYEMTFGIILILTWALKVVVIPGIHIFVLLCLMDHLLEEEKFSRLADLIESGIAVLLKLALSGVIGFGVVQSLLTPAKDRISQSTLLKSLSVLPGVGNGFHFAQEVVLGCGMLVKNCVGAAGLILLLLICATPVVKVFSFHLLYRILGAALEPVSDRRIVKGILGVARGCGLYLKVMVDMMLFFMIAIAMVTASTSFVY
jgi:stage III sporulation protein AE